MLLEVRTAVFVRSLRGVLSAIVAGITHHKMGGSTVNWGRILTAATVYHEDYG